MSGADASSSSPCAAPHIVLSLPSPYPDGVARWVADEIFTAMQR